MGNSLVLTRKALAGAATVAILASQLVVAPMVRAAEMSFSDVPSNEWYAQYVSQLTDMGIIDGYSDGTYKPNNSVNRAEMSKIATKLATMTGVIKDANDISGAPSFSDVPSDQWFYGYVSALAKNKILEGYRDGNGNLTGRFGPGDFVNRAEASKILLLAAGIPSKLTPATPFIDVNPSDWFYEYVTSAYNWSILDGYKLADNVTLTGYFGPGDQVTRAQIAKVAVLAQSPVDRVTKEPLNSNSNMVSNANMNSSNMNTNAPMSNVSFEAALSSATPANKTLATGTAFNDVLKVDLTAGNDEDVKVTGFNLTQRGISTNAVVNGVLVVDKDGMRHGNIVSFSENNAMIDMSGNPLIIKAGTTHTVTVQVNFNAINVTGTFKAEVPANGIKAYGVTSGGMVAVKGTFPISGPEYPLVNGNNIGAVKVDNVQITAATQEVDLGLKNKEVSKFKFEESSSNEEVALSELTLFNNGNTSDTDLENISLVGPDGTILSTVKNTSNRYVTFNLASKPYIIPKGSSRNLSVKVDIVNGSTRTIQFVVSNDYDVKVKGATSGAFLLPTAGTSDTSFAIGDATGNNTLQVKEGTLTVSKDTTSPSGEVSRGSTDVVIASYKVEAAGEDIEIQGGRLDIATASANLKSTIKLVNGSGVTLHSFNVADAGTRLNGTLEGTDNIDRFNNYYTVKAGMKGRIDVVVSLADAATAGQTLLARIGDLKIKKVASNKTGTAAEATVVTGNTMTITAASVSVSKNAATGDTNIVKGATMQKIGSFNLTTTNAESVSISSVNVDLTGLVTAWGITNMKLYKGSTQLGSTRATPTATNNTFGISGELNIDKASSVTVDIYADISASSTATTVQATLSTGAISGTSASSISLTNVPASNVALQSNPVVDNGTVSINKSTDSLKSRVLSAGETASVFSFEVKASNREDMRLERAKVAFPAAAASVTSVELWDGATKVAGPLTLTDGVADFSGINSTIEKNKTKVYTVKAMLSTSSSFNSDRELVGALHYYEVVGSSSGLRTQRLAGSSVVGSSAYSQEFALNDLIYAYDADAANDGFGVVTTAGTTPVTNLTTTAANDVLGRMATLGTDLVATGATRYYKAGQLAYFQDASTPANNGISRINTAGIIGTATVDKAADATLANGDKLALLPTLYTDDAIKAGQLLVGADSAATFATVDGTVAAGTSALPMVYTESVAAAAKPTLAMYMVGDVVAYDTDIVAGGINPVFGVVTAVTATDVAVDGANFVGGAGTGRITKLFSGSGNGDAHILENVRPVFASQTVNFTPTSNAEVAKFTATANGNETLSLNQLSFSVTGSYNGRIGNYKLYQVQGSSETEVSVTLSLLDAAGANADDGNGGAVASDGYIDVTGGTREDVSHRVVMALSSPFNIQPGSSATFVLRADASAAKAAGTQGSVSLTTQLNGQSGVRDTRNSVIYSYTNNATTPVSFTNMNVANEYPVTTGSILIN